MEPIYIIENGYRRVSPYYYTFEAFAKGRWIGKPLFQVFMSEFGGRSASYYVGNQMIKFIKIRN